MTEMMIELEVSNAVVAERIAELLQSRLAELDTVEAVDADVESMRGVAEIVPYVAVAVVLIGQGAVGMESAAKFVKAFRELLTELGEVRKAWVVLRNRKVEVAKLTEKEVAEAIAE
jgi:hypothetical protein